MEMHKSRQTYILVRWLYLRCLGLIHLAAFGSYTGQIIGLNGSHGIAPTAYLLKAASEQLGAERFWLFPTLAWINCSDVFLQAMTYAGIAFSILVVFGIATAPSLAVLAILWLSLTAGGGEFTGFQSDPMLVEATLLTLFFAPWQAFEPPWPVRYKLRKQAPPATISLWLLRFMIFRIMLASGLVKVLSGDPAWANLTAMQYHFETQPIPTPLAWYAHHLPPWLLKSMTAATFGSELLAPWLIFAPRLFRLTGAACMISLHAMIALTGNYTFLNFLSIVLCITLADDRLLRPIFPGKLIKKIEDAQDNTPRRRLILACCAATLLLLAGFRLLGTVCGRQAIPSGVRQVLSWLAPLHIVDSYGLFAVMTTSRPEIVFEGSNDGSKWQSYEFLYKPGDNLKRPPPWVEPHMPRLDWRLWFAAMGSIDESPWVLGLVRRLLDGSPDVKPFFEYDPFPGKPPKYIRAFVYDYHFTDAAERSATGCWWRRDDKRCFLPPVSLENGELVLKSSRLFPL